MGGIISGNKNHDYTVNSIDNIYLKRGWGHVYNKYDLVRLLRNWGASQNNGTVFDWIQRGVKYGGSGENQYMVAEMSKDGTTLVVAEPNFDNSNGDKGKVTIFRTSSNYEFVLYDTITPDNETGVNIIDFGRSLAVSGNGMSVAIGQIWQQESNDEKREKLYSYQDNGTNFDLQDLLTHTDFSTDPNIWDHGHTPTALNHDGSIIVYGSYKVGPSETIGITGNNVGGIRIRKINQAKTEWLTGRYIVGTENDSYLGASVAVSGSGLRFITSVPGSLNDRGEARVYDWSGNELEDPVLIGTGGDNIFLTNPGDTITGDYTNYNVGISNDSSMIAVCGKNFVRTYTYNDIGDSWNQYGQSIEDNIHSNVSLSNNGFIMAISNITIGDNGPARIYRSDAGRWLPYNRLLSGITPNRDIFGSNINLNYGGNKLSITARDGFDQTFSEKSGYVKTYTYSAVATGIHSLVWSEKYRITDNVNFDENRIQLNSSTDNNNNSIKNLVELTEDGTYIAIGYPNQGKVGVYFNNNRGYYPIFNEITGCQNLHSISFSKDGDIVAVACNTETDGERLYVFIKDYDTRSWVSIYPDNIFPNLKTDSNNNTLHNSTLIVSKVMLHPSSTKSNIILYMIYQYNRGTFFQACCNYSTYDGSSWTKENLDLLPGSSPELPGYYTSLLNDVSRYPLPVLLDVTEDAVFFYKELYDTETNAINCNIISDPTKTTILPLTNGYQPTAIKCNKLQNVLAVGFKRTSDYNGSGHVETYHICGIDGDGVKIGYKLQNIVPSGSYFSWDIYYNFGSSLSFSSGGTRLAIGVPNHYANKTVFAVPSGTQLAPGDGLDFTVDEMPWGGAVAIYFLSSDNKWYLSELIKGISSTSNGEPRIYDNLGYSVSLSGDGRLLLASGRGRPDPIPDYQIYTVYDGEFYEGAPNFYVRSEGQPRLFQGIANVFLGFDIFPEIACPLNNSLTYQITHTIDDHSNPDSGEPTETSPNNSNSRNNLVDITADGDYVAVAVPETNKAYCYSTSDGSLIGQEISLGSVGNISDVSILDTLSSIIMAFGLYDNSGQRHVAIFSKLKTIATDGFIEIGTIPVIVVGEAGRSEISISPDSLRFIHIMNTVVIGGPSGIYSQTQFYSIDTNSNFSTINYSNVSIEDLTSMPLKYHPKMISNSLAISRFDAPNKIAIYKDMDSTTNIRLSGNTGNSGTVSKFTLSEVTNITALDTSSDGTRIVVGDSTYPGSKPVGDPFENRGRVCVYNFYGGTTVTLMNIINYTESPLDSNITYRDLQFGASVSINGNGHVIAIGSPTHNGGMIFTPITMGNNQNMPRKGAVVILQYDYETESWLRFKNDIFGEYNSGDLYDHIGYDLAISADSSKIIFSGKGRPDTYPSGFEHGTVPVIEPGRGEPRIYELS